MKLDWLFANREKRKQEIIREIREGRYDLWSLLFPRPCRAFFLRLAIVAAVAWIFFKFFCLPAFLNGPSMIPTYPERGFLLCWTPSVWFGMPEKGRVVVLSYAGSDILLLKRLLATEGDTVEFRDGVCLVNDMPLDEPYLRLPCDWNESPITVKPGKIYVMGDNRSMPRSEHVGGQIDRTRLKGVPLW